MIRWVLILLCLCFQTIPCKACTIEDFEQSIKLGREVSMDCVKELSNEFSSTENSDKIFLNFLELIKSGVHDASVKESHYRMIIQLCATANRFQNVAAKAHYYLALSFYVNDEYERAIDYFQRAADSWLSSAQPDSVQIGKSILNMGVCHFYSKQYKEAETHFNRLLDERWPISARHQAKNLLMLGKLQRIKGNLQLTEQYFKLSGAKHIEHTGDSVYLATDVYRSIGVFYFKFKKYEEAYKYFMLSFNILNKYGESQIEEIYREQNNIAISLAKQNKFAEAVVIYNSLLSKYEYTKNYKEIIRTILNIAGTRIIKMEKGDAMLIDLSAIHHETQLLLKRADSLLVLYPNEALKKLVVINQGQLLRINKQFGQALALQVKQLKTCCNINLDDLLLNPKPLIANEHAADVVETLTRLAAILLGKYQTTEDNEDINQALRYYKLAADYLDQFKTNQFNPRSSVNLGALNKDLTEEVLELSEYKKDWADILYEFVEKSKSTSLLASIQTADAEDHFIDRYPAIRRVKNINQEILEVEKGVADQELTNEEKIEFQEKLLHLNEMLIQANKEKVEILTQEKALTNLYQSLPSDEIQSMLNTETTIISYFMTDDFMYTFVINESGVELIKKEVSARALNAIYNLIQTTSDFKASPSVWIANCNEVSALLLKSILDKTRKKLIVIPDGVLAYLPFEVLLTQYVDSSESYNSLPYLIKEKSISYNFSASILKEMKDGQATGNGFLSMAPEFKLSATKSIQKDAGVPLAHAQKEVDAINAIWKPDYRPTNKREFVADVEKAEIIHFAGHAFLNDEVSENSYMSFSSTSKIEDKLFIREIYNLRTPSELVVLSACNTGQGELKKGEGVMSMARAFAYSGAKSLVYSLWDVNDGSTKKIMERFYQELKDGADKDDALRTAKLAYLDRAKGALQQPYYWAGFVAMGDMRALDTGGENYWLFGLAFLLILAVVMFLFRHRFRS